MSEFEFEELVADMLEVTDEQREDENFLEAEFYKKFDMGLEQGYKLTRSLLKHTPKMNGFDGTYHSFVSKSGPFLLMKLKAE